jgi:hypothetical protein
MPPARYRTRCSHGTASAVRGRTDIPPAHVIVNCAESQIAARWAEKGIGTWGMQRGQHAALTDPLDRLRQLDIRETFEAHGTEVWTVVYRSWQEGDDNLGFFSALAPKRYRATALQNDSWDLSIGEGLPGFMERYDGGRKRTTYLRYGQDRGGLEPLVIIQSRYDIRPRSLPQVSEEFRQPEALTPVVADRTTWERQHGVELQRLENLDRSINLIEPLDQIAMRNLNRRVERGLGVELGL